MKIAITAARGRAPGAAAQTLYCSCCSSGIKRYSKIYKIKRKIAKLTCKYRGTAPFFRPITTEASRKCRSRFWNCWILSSREAAQNMSERLHSRETHQKRPYKFSTFAGRNFQKARIIKSKTTNPLCPKGKTSILEPEEYTALRARPVCPGCV